MHQRFITRQSPFNQERTNNYAVLVKPKIDISSTTLQALAPSRWWNGLIRIIGA